MDIDWNSSQIVEQLALYPLVIAADKQTLCKQLSLSSEQGETVCLCFMLENLDDYGQSWGQEAAEWLVLAVVRMVKEILDDYPTAQWGCVVPDVVVVVVAEDDQQDVGHRCITGYQEIYDVLARTHQKPSSPFWHRRAITHYFPTLSLEVMPS